jgi:aminopeptidase N
LKKVISTIRAIVFGCFLFSSLLCAQVTFNPADLNTIAKGEGDSHARILRPAKGIATSAYNVTFYSCYWTIDPSIDAISGYVTVYFIPKQAGFDTLVLDMNQALVVSGIIYHNTQYYRWDHPQDQLRIVFSNPLPENKTDSVTVFYHGVPPNTGLGTFVQSTHNGTPVIWTLSEPYGASDWWPNKNGLTDKADSIEIYINAALPYKTATNGLLVSSVQGPASTVFHWKHRYPIATYLVCLAVTNYASFTQQVPFSGDTLRLVNYIYPEDSTTAANQLPLIIPMIQLYDSLFGIYPFQKEKYGHAEFGVGGGMEHQTMTFVNAFQFELIAHELAHQWFGDKVTCGSWTDIWLNEGFATYLSGLCYEHLDPGLWQRFRQVRIAQITALPGGSVYCSDTTDISRIFNSRLTYAKGAMILHQLRSVMGDSGFFAALNNYLNDFGLAYGFARTSELKAHLENVYGASLSWYFNDWFTGEGYPQYLVNWTQKDDSVAFTIHQTQSSPTVSFFKLPLELKLKNAGHDTLIRVINSYSGEMFNVRIPFKADSLIFDPNSQIISGNNTVNSIAGHELQASLQLVPNPAADYITFRFGGLNTGGQSIIRVYDNSGRMRDEVIPGPGTREATLNTHEYAPGLYFYTFSGHGFTMRGKFIIKPVDL